MEQEPRPHYVNNAEFYREMIDFKAACMAAPDPMKVRVTESIGSKIMLICERLSYSRDFVRSPHREEMVLDAIENCILYIRNFDPAKSKSPFAYFTQIAYFAFIRRSQRERKSVNTRYEFARQVGISEIIDHANRAGAELGGDDHYAEFANYLSNFLTDGYEPKTEEEKGAFKKEKRTTLFHKKRKQEKEDKALADAALEDLDKILHEETGTSELPLSDEIRLETEPNPLVGLDSLEDDE